MLDSAARIRCDTRVERLLDVCGAKLAEPIAQASLWSTVRKVCAPPADSGNCVTFRSPEEVPADGVSGDGPDCAVVMTQLV